MFSILKKPLKAILRRRHYKLENAFAADVHLLLDGEEMQMVDVGASGGVLPRWYPYRGDISFVGFEPDSRSSAVLLQSEDAREFKNYQIIPYGAWSREGTIPISFTRKPMCSSHFQPNLEFLNRFPESTRFDITGSGDVECHTVDNHLSNSTNLVDFMKLDLEGGELAVLQGSRNVLRTCLGLHVEVSFQHLRKEQPLFGDISNFLGNEGIEFVDFIYISRWERGAYRETGQSVFGDALFLRSPENILNLVEGGILQPGKIKVYLAILLIYERYDLAVKMLDLIKDMNMGNDYMRVATSLIERRMKLFDARVKTLARLDLLTFFLNPNTKLHYLY